MKGIKRIVIVLGTCLSVVLGLAGCGPTFEERTEEMLAYMNAKYGVEFQVDWDSQALTREYHSWNCSIKGNTDESQRGKIEVQNWYDKEEEPYVDTYFSIMVYPVVEERVTAALNGVTEQYKIYVGDSSFVDNKYHSIEQFDEYLKEYGNDFAGYVVKVAVPDQGDEATNEALSHQIKECLVSANIGNAYFNIFFMSEEVYESMDKSNMMDVKQDSYVYRYAGRVMASEEEIYK